MAASFSRRSEVPSETNRFSRALAARRASARPWLDLADSNPSAVGLAWPAQQLSNLLTQADAVRYRPEPFGIGEARVALAAQLSANGIPVSSERLMLSASTSEAYGFLFKLLCDAGDNVLVPTPSYPLFDMLAALEGVEQRRYALRYDGRWHVDLGALRSAIDPRTRAILLVHPNNPTGSYVSRSELDELAALGLPLISDEVFAEYPQRADAQRAASAWLARDRALVFRMGGLSKSLALPQLKLAWTAIGGPEPLVQAAVERLGHIADTYLSVATPVQLALPGLLAHGATMRARLAARVQQNLAVLQAQFADSAVSVLDCEGGWYAIARLPSFVDDEEWAIELLERHDVLVQPGFFYDLPLPACVVLSLISEEEVLREGARRIRAAVEHEAGR
jgi:aspartate/methionine/tyrosine aminotransferase